MKVNRCAGCMAEIETYPCPVCGYDPAGKESPNYALPINTILAGRYLIGRILGQGGFGITYVAWDLTLEKKVAVKEYYPSGMVTRHPSCGTKLLWNTGEQTMAFRQTGIASFIKEARKMMKVNEVPNVVRVLDTFDSNETAYIIMDYVEGETLKAKLDREGPISWEDAKEIFFPAMETLAQVHKAGLIHRDMSPDNLMLQPDGTIRVLDLGAAKDTTINSGASSMLVAKGGFSPIEQYAQRGGSGTWTDVYAVAASIYYSLTGTLPPSAVDRLTGDTTQWDLPGLKDVPEHAIAAMQNAMIVAPTQRTQTMDDFLKAIRGEVPVPAPQDPAAPKKSFPWIAAVAVLAVAVGAGVFFLRGRTQPAPQVSAPPAETEASTEAAVPETADASEEISTEAPAEEPTEAPTEPIVVGPAALMRSSDDLSLYHEGNRMNTSIWGSDRYHRIDAVTMTFHNNMDGVPESIWNSWDVSAAGDRSILAWMEGQDLHIAADGPIRLNPDCSWMFSGFRNLKSIDFGGCVDTHGVTNMNRMFCSTENIESLPVEILDTSSVTSMDRMFECCKKLKKLDLSTFRTGKVTDFSGMFSECYRLEELNISGLDTSSARSIDGMFNLCSSLKKLDLSSFDTRHITSFYAMFSGCSSLTELDLSSFDTANASSMAYMFSGCGSLSKVNLTSFNTVKVTNMSGMFYGCMNLNEPNLDSFDFVNVTDYDDFMHRTATVHGRPWKELFWQELLK